MGFFHAVKNTFRLFPLAYSLASESTRLRGFAEEVVPVRQYVDEALRRFSLSLDETWQEPVMTSLLSNWAVNAPLLAKGYATMLGKEPSYRTLKAQGLVGMLGIAHDHLCDDLGAIINDDRLDALFYHPDDYEPLALADAVSLLMYQDLRTLFPPEEFPLYHAILGDLHEVQKDSRRQRDSSITFGELFRFTMGKGAGTVHAIMQTLKPRMPPHHPEYAMHDAFDYFQLIDDVGDRRRDEADGIHTLATECSPDIILNILDEHEEILFDRLRSLPYGRKALDWFMFQSFVAAVPARAALVLQGKGFDAVLRDMPASTHVPGLRRLKYSSRLLAEAFRTGWRYRFEPV